MNQPNPEENPLWWGREVGEEEWELYNIVAVDHPRDGEGGLFAFDVIEREGEFLKHMVDMEWKPCEPPSDVESAAPELLEELEDLYSLVKGECPRLLNEDSGGNADQDERIRAAIAKAKGEA